MRWERGNDNGGFAAPDPAGARTRARLFHPRIPPYERLPIRPSVRLTGSVQFHRPTHPDQPRRALRRLQIDRAEQYLEAISFSRAATASRDGDPARGSGRFDQQLVSSRSQCRCPGENRPSTRFAQIPAIYGSLHKEFGERFRFDGLAAIRIEIPQPDQDTVALDVLNVQG